MFSRTRDGIAGACIVGLLLAATPAQASAADKHTVSIPAGRLGDAIIALGHQTGSSIGMSDQRLASLPVRGIDGQLSAGQALDRLLDGTSAKAVRIARNIWRITARQGQRRAPPVVTASLSLPPALPGPDIIVTGSKRQIPLARFAGPVEFVDHDGMRSGDAASGTAALIDRIPSLSSTQAGAGRNKLFVRGIADSGFAGPTQATTGQYLGDMRLNYAAPDPDLRLYDIAGIEVLEGPQGTLYGAGSLGGIVRLMPNPPDLDGFGGQVNAGLSATQHGDPGGDIGATMNLPLAPGQLGLRLVGYTSQEGGYIDDSLRGIDNINRTRIAGGRAMLRYAPDERWTVDLTGLYQRIAGRDAQYGSRSAGTLALRSPVQQNYLTNYALASIRVEHRWDDMTFVSTTGIVDHRLTERYDATQPAGPPGLYVQNNRTRMITTESRLSRDLHDGLGWLVGLSWLDNRATIRRTLGPVDTPLPSTGVRNAISEWTAFAEASVEPVDSLIVTAGGRLTDSRLTGIAMDPARASLLPLDIARAEAQADRRETVFLPSIALMTDALRGVALFLRYQQGFRPGGLAVDDFRVRRFRNDRIGTLEAGFRYGAPGFDPVALAGSMAWTRWRDIQADLTDRQGLPTTANIGDGRIYTLEGRMVLTPMPGLSMDISGIYNDSRLIQPSAYLSQLSYAGQSLALPNVAGLGGRIALDYRTLMGDNGGLHLSASARYIGHSRLGVGPVFGRAQGNYVETAIAGSWSRGAVRYSAGVTNLFDATGNRFALGTPFDLDDDDYTPMRPRTVRIGIDYAF